jgi:catechol 2,3-dioxygenase
MGVTRVDIFGTQSAEPATPDSYGEPPRSERLPATTRVGPVVLQVADAERSIGYYEGVLGLRVVDRDGGRVRLGTHGAGHVLVELEERRGARPAPSRGRLGLYHFAILVPDRTSLGRLVAHLAEVGARAGAADHLVSEALYLQDPDNLGIEVYADRPRDQWRRAGRELVMATDPLDLPSLIEAAGGERWSGMPAGTTMGHVHLHVGDIPAAQAFYSEALGFDRMVWSYPGALFLAAGGYHHHLGTNTWAGPRAAPAEPDEARLLEWTLELPDESAVQAATQRLAGGGHEVTAVAAGETLARDPWGTAVRLRDAGARAEQR